MAYVGSGMEVPQSIIVVGVKRLFLTLHSSNWRTGSSGSIIRRLDSKFVSGPGRQKSQRRKLEYFDSNSNRNHFLY